MQEAEAYSPVDSVQVYGFTISEVQETPATLSTLPFRSGSIPQFHHIVTQIPARTTEGRPLRRISNVHGRSYEVLFGRQKNVLWADEFGNLFMNLNTKGNNVTSPEVCVENSSPSGFIIYGLQDSYTIVRNLKASHLLRANNIETEAFVNVIEPAELPLHGELVSQSEFKNWLVSSIPDNQDKIVSSSGRPLAKEADIPKLQEAFNHMVLYVTVRGTQVNERLADLADAYGTPEADEMIRNTFRYINEYERIKSRRDPSYSPRTFSADNQADVNEYFNEYLPKRIARNFAGIHKLGLVVDYPHTGNWSTVGSFYDLDSVKGEPLGLGDKPVSQRDIIEDVYKFLTPLKGAREFPSPQKVVGALTSGENKFRENFLRAYIDEMGWGESMLGISSISELLTKLDDPSSQKMIDPYLDKFVKKLNLQPAMNSLTKRYILDAKGKQSSSDDSSDQGMVELAFKQASIKDILNGIIPEVTKAYGKPPREFTPDDIFAIFNFSVSYTAREVVNSFGSVVKLPNAAKLRQLFSGSLRQSAGVVDKYRCQTYQNLVKLAGWEEQIVRNMERINDLFGEFESAQALEYLDYYIELLAKETGWEFSLSENLEEMINRFHVEDQIKMHQVIDEALQAAPIEESVDSTIHSVFGNAEKVQAISPYPFDRYVKFVKEYVDDQFMQERAQEVEELKQKYGKENADVITLLIKRRIVDRYIENLPDDVVSNLTQDSEKRVSKLRSSFSPMKDAFPPKQ